MTFWNWHFLGDWVRAFAASHYADNPDLCTQFALAVCNNESAFQAVRVAAHYGIETLGIREAA